MAVLNIDGTEGSEYPGARSLDPTCYTETTGSRGGDWTDAAQPTPTPTSSPPALLSASTCADLGWTNAEKFGSSAVCGESDMSLGGCSGALTWPEARHFCEASGARMCSVAELKANEAKSTGCGYDKEQVWASDRCGGSGFSLAFGAKSGGSETACAAGVGLHQVRCCADVFGGSPEGPTMTPSRAPAPPAVISASSCGDLKWANAAEFGSSIVCGESDLSLGGCSGDITWPEAREFCEEAGARMCSVAEMHANEARSTGCGLDKKQLWTSDSCGSDSFSTAYGASNKGTGSDCELTSTLRSVRCCADVGVGIATVGPTPFPTVSPVNAASASTCDDLGWTNTANWGDSLVCGESDFLPGRQCSGKVSWSEARAFCEAGGARLCTASELQLNEARSTGCGLDKALLWTGTACGGEGGAGFVAAMGASFAGKETLCAAGPEQLAAKLQGARCCADVSAVAALTGSPTSRPTASPAVTLSASSCGDLGWANAASFGSSVVCGESDLGLGGCSGKLPWAGAKAFCEQKGARLCSAAELLANEARSTGCGLDRALLWTRDGCDDSAGGGRGGVGFTLAYGATFGGSSTPCAEASALNEARCCADL